MNKCIIWGLALCLAASGCSKKDKTNKTKAQSKVTTPTEVKATPPVTPEPPKKMTGEQLAARHQECMAAWSAKDEVKFKGCLTAGATVEMVDSGLPPGAGPDGAIALAKGFWTGFPDIKSEPQLILVNGNHVVSIDYLSGTNTGEFNAMPATNKKIGLLIAHVVEVDDVLGKAKRVQGFVDMATMMGQLGLNPKGKFRPVMEKGGELKIVVGGNAAAEPANLAAVRSGVEKVNAHDATGLAALFADDGSESDQTAPLDIKGKAALTKNIQGWFAAFPDVKLTLEKELGAGDYVANVGWMEGTNTGDMKAWGLKKTGKSVRLSYVEIMKLTDGKVTELWRFWNCMAMATQLGLVPPPGGAGGTPP